MPHPDGGRGNTFPILLTFKDARKRVEADIVEFETGNGRTLSARASHTRGREYPTIAFEDGNVCEQCWGFRENCSGTRIGQCVEGLIERLTRDSGT